MQLLTPLTTLLTFQLLQATVLAGGSYFGLCTCLNANNERVGPGTQAACDAINHSDYHELRKTGEFKPRCVGTPGNAINNNCFDCLCKRTAGLHGWCDPDSEFFGWNKIKCGGGC